MPEIQVIPGERFFSGEAYLAAEMGPAAALDAMIGSFNVLDDLSGRSASPEALNPVYFRPPKAPPEDVPWSREPRELWALLWRITAWKDLVPVPPIEMGQGRMWISGIEFATFGIDLIVVGAAPQGQRLVLLVLQAVPLGSSPDMLDDLIVDLERTGEVTAELAGALT